MFAFRERLCLSCNGRRTKSVRIAAFQFGNVSTQSWSALWRRVLTGLLLCSFFWISYVSQTHIHSQPATLTSAGAILKNIVAHQGQPGQAPGQHAPDDPADCPLCQAVGLGGAAILPILIALVLIQVTAHVIPVPQLKRVWASRVDAAHQTRGPPTL
jgi:hypothetical protein